MTCTSQTVGGETFRSVVRLCCTGAMVEGSDVVVGWTTENEGLAGGGFFPTVSVTVRIDGPVRQEDTVTFDPLGHVGAGPRASTTRFTEVPDGTYDVTVTWESSSFPDPPNVVSCGTVEVGGMGDEPGGEPGDEPGFDREGISIALLVAGAIVAIAWLDRPE